MLPPSLPPSLRVLVFFEPNQEQECYRRCGRAGHFGKLQHLKIGKTTTAAAAAAAASEVYASPGDRQVRQRNGTILDSTRWPVAARGGPNEVFVPRELAQECADSCSFKRSAAVENIPADLCSIFLPSYSQISDFVHTTEPRVITLGGGGMSGVKEIWARQSVGPK